LGDPENFAHHLKNKFDIVTIAGLINSNHLDYGLFEEITLALKQNGLAIFAARYSYLGEYWYDFILDDMVK
jgi:SAM-dependent methyltransferase